MNSLNSLYYGREIFFNAFKVKIFKIKSASCTGIKIITKTNASKITETKTKILQKLQNTKALNIVYNGTVIRQYAKVKYLGSILDESLSCESMALNVIDKVNSRLQFLHKHNRFLTTP